MSTSRRRKSFVTGALAALLVSLTGIVAAEEAVSPADVKVSTPVYQPSFGEFVPSFGRYTYSVSWQGIPAASVTFDCQPDGLYYRMQALAKTAKGVDLFYKLRYRAEGTISAVDFLPVKITVSQSENSRRKFTSVEFKGDNEVYAFRQTAGGERKEMRFTPNNFMLDPFSAAFLARSQHWDLGETKEFDTFNGKSRYLIRLTATERTRLKFNGEYRDVWVIVPKVLNLVNSQQTKKLREAKIYVSADQKRDVLKIISSVFIGSVNTELESFEPLPNAAPGMALARRDTATIWK